MAALKDNGTYELSPLPIFNVRRHVISTHVDTACYQKESHWPSDECKDRLPKFTY